MAAFWKILVKYRMLFIGGVKITLIVSVLTIILGTFFGILMAFMKMSKIKPLRWFANTYVEFIRGTPVLVQISLVFYGLPMMGINIPSIMVGGTDISRLAAGIIALTINKTAYICEIVRGALDMGWIKGAGLDVLASEEPELETNPLVGRENVILTPHSAFYSVESLRALQDISCDNVAYFLKGEYEKVHRIINN